MLQQSSGAAPWRRFATLVKAGGTRLLAQPPVTTVLRRRATAHGAISVLVYHTLGVDGEDFDAWTVLEQARFRSHVAMLRSHYDIVSLDEALESLGQPSRRPRAVLTFDDGEHGLYAHLLPLIDELCIPVTIYIATRHIEADEPYWFDAIMNALQTSGPLVIDLAGLGLPPVTVGETAGAQNWIAIGRILEHLKSLSEERRLDAVRDVQHQASHAKKRRFTPMRPLTLPELKAVAGHTLVTIGAHTHCHSLLDKMDLDRAESSVRTSVRLLQEWTGRKIEHFAYPNGNHTPDLERLMQRAGFKTAAVGGGLIWATGSNVFALPRVPVGRYDTSARLQLRLVGI